MAKGISLKLSRFNLCCHYAGRPGYLVLYNTFSGACILLQKRQYRSLAGRTRDGGTVKSEDGDLDLAEWLRLGFLVHESVDEIANLRYFTSMRRYSDRRSSLTLTIAPTMRCNLSCVYCFEGSDRECVGGMQEETMFSLWRLVENGVRRNGILSVCWYGGEPLLELHNIIKFSRVLLKIADRKLLQFTANIITNGTLMTAEAARALRNARVSLAQITVDGPETVHNLRRPAKGGRKSFRAVLKGIENASQYMNVHIRVNLDKRNVAVFESFLDYLEKCGITDNERVSVYPGYTRYFTGNGGVEGIRQRAYARKWMLSAKEFGEQCLRLERRMSHKKGRLRMGLSLSKAINVCGALCLNSLVVRGDGEVFKCWGECSDSANSCGNINRGLDLFSVNMTRWLGLDLFADQRCLNCAVLPVCMGGCAFTILNGYPVGERCSPLKYMYPQVLNELVTYRIREESSKTGVRPALFFGHRQL